MKKLFSILIGNSILAILLANRVFAQEELGINDLAEGGIFLGTRSIQETIAGIVNIFLGFLGILATLLILYGGYLWMTSRGNAEKVERAKLLIASALIGLVIIVSAYAVSRFILSRLYEETGPSGPGGGGSGPGGGGLPTCDEPLDPDDPLVCSLSNSSGPVGSGLTLQGWHFDTDGDNAPGVGRVEIDGVVAEIVECNGSPMWDDRKVKVKIPDSLTPGNYEVILYNDVLPGGLASIENPHFDFTVTPGTSSVNIDCLIPEESPAVNLPINVQILGNGFTDISDNVSMNAWVSGVETPIDLNINSWSDLEINAEIPVNALSSNIMVSVGSEFDQEFFDVSCGADGECSSGCCSDNSCLADSICSGTIIPGGSDIPVIQSISPEDGEDGTLLTIFGYNFGNDPGVVTFDGIAGDLPSALSGGICADIWTDNYIIVGVPAGANGVLDVVVTQSSSIGGESSDPYPGFDRNDTIRPGICDISDVEGQYGDVVDIQGINFTATDHAYFDTVASYDTNIISSNNANAEVPNVVGNLGLTLQSTAAISSNAFPFLALSVSGGAPIINEVSPDNGPVDSYVTIMGSNFGHSQGLVWFDPDNNPNNANEIAGSFDFPTVCGDYWFDDYIIVKVPAGPWVIGNDYSIRIERNPDGVLSNDFDFTITDIAPGPQICSVTPDNGPIGNLVTISGENFGTSLGSVLFYDNVSASTIANWSSNQIFGVEIPLGAQTGPLLVRDSANNDSNSVAFSVGECNNDLQCGVEFCCQGDSGNYCAASCDVVPNSCEYTWDVSTQSEPFELYYNYSCASQLQSPTPWPDEHEGLGQDGFLAPQSSLDAFVDTNISALFTRDVEDTDFIVANVQLWQCGNGAFFDPAACTNQIFDNDGILEILNHNTNREGFTFDPVSNLLPDTWYQVRLGTFNAEIGTDSWTPDPVSDDWHFKTRDSDLLCEVSSVVVTPQSPQANMYPGREKTFSASPIADNCNICGGDYDWQWSLGSDPAPINNYASITGPLINNSINQGYTRLEGGPMSTELISTPNNVTLIAENSNFAISGETYPIILAPRLIVEGSMPSCSDSCTEVAVWVDFNTDLNAPLNINDFSIYRCLDLECSGWDSTNNYTNNLNSYQIPGDGVYRVDILHDPLPPNENYIVLIDKSISNVHGYPLGIDYRWNFGVSDNNCIISGANILPDNYTVNSLNNFDYKAYAIAEAGICGAQAIQCENCNWSWSSDNPSVATISPGGIGAQTVMATPLTSGVTNINLDIDGTALGLGQASDSTPLTVDVSGSGVNTSELVVNNYWPNCDGACDNSEVGVSFNMPIDETTLGGQYSITDLTDSTVITSGYNLIGNGQTLIIEHTPLILGHSYSVIVDLGIQNTDGEFLAAPFTFNFTVGQSECQIIGANVDPDYIVAGANQGVIYHAQTLANTVSCGNIPVYCDTCTYDWTNIPNLGTFDNNSLQSPIFTTAATVVNGDSISIDLDVIDQGSLFEDSGTIDIAINTPMTSEVRLINVFPPTGVNYCTNIVPYMDFDISNGDLDRNSLMDQAIFIDTLTGNPIEFSNKFLELIPGVLTVLYEPKDLLAINSNYFFGFNDISQVVAQGGGQIIDEVGLAFNGLLNLGRFFQTGDNTCVLHRVEVFPSNDKFICIDNNGCQGDASGINGNQHLYQSVAYDIQNNILSSASLDYVWSSDKDNIVFPESINTATVLGTAGENGLAHLNLQTSMTIDPGNIKSDSNSIEVNTCQKPWPSLTNYPWNDGALPDMNFSTYYCQEYGLIDETPLPNIDVPHITSSPDPKVIREYISTIDYPLALNDNSKYFGSLAYYEDGVLEKPWFRKLASLFGVEKAHSQVNPSIDIIAFRVMDNTEHLSVWDWYKKNAPNPQAGQMISVDGYEALQVGASIYVAASNIEGSSIYTNIYIIAHNVGANDTTLEIYDQLVDNFKLNVNITAFADNTCNGQTALSCSSDFDCPNYCDNFADSNESDCLLSGANWLPDVCNASLLKLRRDTKRLADLVNINNTLLAYGQNHKACLNNSLISCQTSDDCPSGGACVPYFPQLNSGSYLNGSSNTSWPSWQDTLAGVLGVELLPEDPINLFNGCSDPYNVQTCWNESDLDFICPANSLIYMYNISGVGQSYDLGAKFEFDMQTPTPAITFANNLNNPVTMDLDINSPYCNAMVLNAPGASASPRCGNGIINSDYCSEPIYNNQFDCENAGGTWVETEECDSNFWNFACSQSPPSANPPIPTVGNQQWWNEQTIGCNPPGAIDTNTGELIECTWYRPNPPLVAAQCGGYCGDGQLQSYYETCDGSLPSSDYTCAEAGVSPYCGNGCQVLCDNGSEIYPAALCGDGIWSQGTEQCDPTANPNGLSGWDCTGGGGISCSNSCERVCSTGSPYLGLCGDGDSSPLEEICDYASYDPPLPTDSSVSYTYGCTLSCQMNNEYCGDGIVQYAYQELCDYGNGAYDSPEPIFSDEFNQYACRSQADGLYTSLSGIQYEACTATLDGWCGDGKIQDGILYPDYGEECDPGAIWDEVEQNPPAPTPENSSITNQYVCDVDCVGRVGGYCGDGNADEPYEVCDGTDYPSRPIPFFSGPNNTYACADDCSGGAVDGGYCGDGIKNDDYYEACDWGIEGSQDVSNYPWPRGDNLSNFSSEMNQYVCSSCVNFGGYCGNGIVDGACSVNCTDCDQNDNNCQSPVGCTEYQCQLQGGTFFPYEQCDNGYDPAYIVNKDVDIVYVFDTSGSMESAAADLCKSTATVVNTLNVEHPDINYRITIFPMGDGDATDGLGSELTATNTDNIQYFFELENGVGSTEPWYDGVFDALYSDCLETSGGLIRDLASGTTIDPRVRYLSLYDDASNDINGPVDIYAGDGVNEFCAAYDATENWGYAIKRIAEDYNWLAGYHRIIVPVSDEHAVCGGNGPANSNEDFNNSDGIYDILVEAVDSCTANPSNPVFINPVLLNSSYLGSIGLDMADATGGLFTNSSTGWEVQTLQVINSTICDGVGGGLDGTEPDGHMDCVLDNSWTPLEPPVSPACRVEGQSCAFIPCCTGASLTCNASQVCEGPAGDLPVIDSSLTVAGAPNQPFTYTITATNNPSSFNATGLPAGLSVNTATGVISGSTAVLGTHIVTITASNVDGSDTAILNLTISAAPVITSQLAATGTSGQPFTYTIVASNNPSSFNVDGFLPAGLSINSSTGVISGVTTAIGIHNVNIVASNVDGSDTKTLIITILAPTPVITSPLTASVDSGQPFTYTITAGGNPSSFNATGLPAGLSVNTATGVISGSTTVVGTHNINITATNTSGSGSATLTLTVSDSLPIITSVTSAIGRESFYFAYLIQASGNPSSFGATNLPLGLTINTTTGVISGTPTTAGFYNATISATNTAGTGSTNLFINIDSCVPTAGACGPGAVCCSGYSCNSSNVCEQNINATE